MLRRIHLVLTVAWAAMTLPTLLWWRESILWVAFMSIWANVASHWGAWQATRAERAAGIHSGGVTDSGDAGPS